MSFINTREILGDQATLDALIAHTLTELKEDGVTALADYALYKNDGLITVEMPNLLIARQYAFSDCTALTTIITPGLTSVGNYAFSGCTNLTTIGLSNVTFVGNHAFDNCANLGVVMLPACTFISSSLCQESGPAGFDFTQKITIPTGAFSGNYNMQHLILRSDQICTLSDVSAFTGTPIAAGLGYIYVPADLVDTYKAASNWSTYAAQIQPISAYPKAVTGSISDTWAQIFEAEQNGTYSSKYAVGDTKIVDIDGTSVLMQIVTMDTDVLASDNTQTAPITWISVGILEDHSMNNTSTTSGGWANSAMRTYIRETLFPKIESTVRLNIKEVNKTYKLTNSVLTVADTVWIPSYREILGETSHEDSGPFYSAIFNSAASRVKRESGLGIGAAKTWWLRSVYSSSFRSIKNNGTANYNSPNSANGLVLGFCT